MSVSTVTGIRTRVVAEADGVLQMLRWLNRAPESFLRGLSNESGRLLPVSEHLVLRFDTKKIHVALDLRRRQRKMTWTQVAEEIGLGTSTLTHLGKGSRTYFPHIMRIVGWLGRPSSEFMRACER